jgi:hypothetical protein
LTPQPTSSPLTLPDFLGIGAQKSGTTWLHSNLRAHPDAFLPEPKEVHYFDQKLDQPLETYAEIFGPAGSRLKGEITPAYGILPPETIRFIRQTMPDLRLIFLMRNPIDRAWSHALMSLTWQINRPYESVTAREFLDHFHSPASLMRGDYETILNNWLAEFPADRLFCGFFDDIAARPRQLLTDVFAHLQLSVNVDWQNFPVGQVIYKGSAHPLPPEFQQVLSEIYAPQIRRLADRFGAPVEKWLT